MKGRLTISFDKRIRKQNILEYLMNHGNQVNRDTAIFFLSLYAMEKGMKFNELSYYINLIGENHAQSKD